MSTYSKKTLYLVVILLVLASSVGCQKDIPSISAKKANTNRLKINLRDEVDNPIKKFKVIILRGDTVVHEKQNSTQIDLDSGKDYTIKVSKEGYHSIEKKLMINKNHIVTLQLKKKSTQITDNLLQNGNFSEKIVSIQPNADGSLNTENNWTAYYNSAGKAHTTIVNGRAIIDVSDPGENPWSVQLLQSPIPIKNNTRYRLSFEAKADKQAELHYKIGGISTRSWIAYSENTVKVNESMNKYTFDFKMEAETDLKSRMEIWALESTKYTIDHVMLSVLEEPSSTNETNKDKEIKFMTSEIIKNGSFENNTVLWKSKEAVNMTTENGLLEAIISEKTGKLMYQHPIKLVEGIQYNIQVKGKAKENTTVSLKLFKKATEDSDSVDYLNDPIKINLTNKLKTYTFNVLMSHATDEAAQFTLAFENNSPTESMIISIDDIDISPDVSFYQSSKITVNEKVDKIIQLMTLDEKVGQMSQGERKNVSPEDVQKFNLGSLLSGGGSTPGKNAPEDWIEMYNAYQKKAVSTRLQIPLLYGVDSVHGHSNLKNATIFPHNIALGAAGKGLMTFARQNEAKEMMYNIGKVTALETAATGIDWNFGPAVSVVRDIRWGRTYESYGEHPELQSLLVKSYIQGEQGINAEMSGKHIVGTAKHFIGDGGTIWGTGTNDYTIDRGDVVTDLEHLKEIHLEGYKQAIIADVGTIMASYNSINGVKMHGSTLISSLLKDQLGFEGFVISDWEGVNEIKAPTRYDQIVKSVNAGVDMFMEPNEWKAFMLALKKAVLNGDVREERIDEAVRRILTIKFKANLFDDPYAKYENIELIGSPQHREVARDAVRKSLVLLKNNSDVLPLKKESNIYIIGKNADNLGNQCGGWTIKWQGFSGNISTKGTTIQQSFEQKLRSYPGQLVDSYDKADTIVLVLGEKPYAEGKGDNGTLQLSTTDKELLEEAIQSNKEIVVVLVSGRPLIITEYIDKIDSLVMAWLPGTEGQGVIDVLYGEYNFTGKLPVTWPRTVNQLPITYEDQEKKPLFKYGYGLQMKLN